LEQAARRPEDDATSIAKTVSENYDDEELRETFLEIVIQLLV
jgi:nuclear cap-binding protein subunit 1